MITDQDIEKLRQVFATKDDIIGLQQDFSSVKLDVSDLKQNFLSLKGDVSGLKQDFSSLKGDVSGLKQDVSGLKQDVSSLKRDVSGLKQDVSGLKQDFSSLKRDVSGLKQDVSEIKSEMKEFVKKKDLEEFGSTISSEFKIVIDMVGDLHTKFDEQEAEIRSTRIFKGETESRLQGIERHILRITK